MLVISLHCDNEATLLRAPNGTYNAKSIHISLGFICETTSTRWSNHIGISSIERKFSRSFYEGPYKGYDLKVFQGGEIKYYQLTYKGNPTCIQIQWEKQIIIFDFMHYIERYKDL